LYKRNLALLLVLILVVTSFAGCASKEEPVAVKTLTWNLGSDPKTIDPGLNSASDGSDMINNMFEGLLREVGGVLQPGMAESYTVSEDLTTYTFTMRDALWSDGEPVTAYDFDYAWTRVLDPVTASEYSWIFDEANISFFKATDAKTFQVVLSVPTPYFIGLMGFFTFMPVREDSVVQGPDGSWAIDPEKSITNGPFKLDEYLTGDKIVLVKNENYWQADKVKLDRIEAIMITEATTALTAFESGEINVIDNMPTEEMPRLMAEDERLYIVPMDGVYYYAFNSTVEPLNDVNVRKALSLAIDRSAIVDQLKGGQEPAGNMISRSSFDAEGNIFADVVGSYYPLDGSGVADAQELLAEAGFPGGEGFPELVLMYNTSEGHKMIAEIIQQMWKTNLGIDISLTNQEWAVFQTTRKERDFEIARCGWIGDYSDPMTYLGMFLSGYPNNYGEFLNDDYDSLLAESKTVQGQARFELLYEAADLLMEGAVYMPIYYYTDAMMVDDTVIDWEKTTRNAFWFGFADIVE